MQPTDIGRLVSLADPRVSPDGTQVAFVVTRTDLDANRYRSSIWLAATDGSTPPYQLTSGDRGDAQPVWSPDGRRLAFTSRRAADDSLFTLNVVPVGAPGETVTLCERPEAVEAPAWSPDGRWIAFGSRERTGRYADGDDDAARPPRRIDRLWSRIDSVGWTIDRPRSAFVVPADGSAAPRLVAGGQVEYNGLAWAPDSRRLALTAARGKDWDLDLVDDLHIVELGPGDPIRTLTDHSVSHGFPSWSPDGTSIATLTENVMVSPSFGRVTVTDAATGERRVLTADLDRQCQPLPGARSPVWSGDDLLFSLEDRGDVHVYRIPADGSGPAGLVVGGSRVVSGFDVAGEVLAFVASSPTELAELFVRDADGTERRLTGIGAAFHDAVATVVPEYFTVASPAGDDEIDAWMVRPTGVPDGGRVPLLLSVHGGPMTQYGNSWFDEFQLWAAAGYAVVWCNPHGSTGRGEAWAQAIRPPEAAEAPGTGWGGIDADDVLAVLDATLARAPELDPDRVGVLGGSYGGFMTTWLISHTDRFAAACSERAANNLESLEWASDAAGFFRREFGATHLDEPQMYRRMSPMSYVADIHTPVLILHSEDDLRCSIEQADQLFVALRLLGRPTEYWRFPGESHELSRSGSPRHRVHRAEIILDWFGRHLGGRRPTITWDHPSRG